MKVNIRPVPLPLSLPFDCLSELDVVKPEEDHFRRRFGIWHSYNGCATFHSYSSVFSILVSSLSIRLPFYEIVDIVTITKWSQSFIVSLSETYTIISSMAPSLLRSATSHSFPICTRSHLVSLSIECVSFVHCCALRSLTNNKLSGTIPPQLGNLMKLHELYAQYRIVLVYNIYRHHSTMVHLEKISLPNVCPHSFIVNLLGTSPLISSMALFHLSSATSLSWDRCTLIIASFSLP